MKLIKVLSVLALLGGVSTAFADAPAGEPPCNQQKRASLGQTDEQQMAAETQRALGQPNADGKDQTVGGSTSAG